MYLEGVDFRAIGRIFNIRYSTVYQWVNKSKEQVSLPQNPDEVPIIGFALKYKSQESKKTYVKLSQNPVLEAINHATSAMSPKIIPGISESV